MPLKVSKWRYVDIVAVLKVFKEVRLYICMYFNNCMFTVFKLYVVLLLVSRIEFRSEATYCTTNDSYCL